MPKRNDIKSILIIGAGPIVIGQACEFDYSGTQACKALRKEGFRIILLNPNPASIMTDPEIADATYIEPIIPEVLEKILQHEQPDAVLPTMGGQTSLNAVKLMDQLGMLQKYQVKLIGADIATIDRAEDRKLFQACMQSIGLECPKSVTVTDSAEILPLLDRMPLPLVIRPSFTLGGTGGGIARTRQEYLQLVESGLASSLVHSVLIEEYLDGWKEFEMEVVRDNADNCIVICSIENLQPMGVHTGDSITVAPALTLTDKEYQQMRSASFAVMRAIGVETGGANVQFAVNPDTGQQLVIEMNPRVSRSSALASKATGYPIAKVAALLAVGYTLDELANDITRVTPASFEPVIDYVVIKFPLFCFDKFPDSPDTLTTTMRSVGEAMAIGRNFTESLQKAIRSTETGHDGLTPVEFTDKSKSAILAEIARPSAQQLWQIAQAVRLGLTISEIQQACRFDLWFLRQIATIVELEHKLSESGLPKTTQDLQFLKAQGFSDRQLAELTDSTEVAVRKLREQLQVLPSFRCVDTCAGEIAATTSYFYSSYAATYQQETEPLTNNQGRPKVIVIGSGPNRIGQGIEFDYSCVHAVQHLQQSGYQAIIINCNPETVSTDYNVSDRLYFVPICFEEVLNIIRHEQSCGEVLGVILQFGGQSPLKLAEDLVAEGINILGTSAENIDLAEDRDNFSKLLTKLGLRQPESKIATTLQQALEQASSLGFPLLIRPSYVLGGQAMHIVFEPLEMEQVVKQALAISANKPVLLDSFLPEAIEVDCDLIADGESVWIAGILEHIEEAGIHSGDSACSLPPHSLGDEMIQQIRRAASNLAKALEIKGLLNIQFAIKDTELYVIEVNPRSSRTIPFIAKAIGVPVAGIAAAVIAGKSLTEFNLPDPLAITGKYSTVKEAVFPFSRFPEADLRLGPEMRSTGEVMGIDSDFRMAFIKSQIAAGMRIPKTGIAFISVIERDKQAAAQLAQRLNQMGFKIWATAGTARVIARLGITVETVLKYGQAGTTIVDHILANQVDLLINTAVTKRSNRDSAMLRRLAVIKNIAYFSTMKASRVAVTAMEFYQQQRYTLTVAPIQHYLNHTKLA